MKMFFSPRGVPVIELNDDINLLFGISSAVNGRIKWIIISGEVEVEIKLKKGKSVSSITEKQGFSEIVDLKFRKIPREVKAVIPDSELKRVKRLLEKYMDANETVSLEDLQKVEKTINKPKKEKK